MTEKHRDATEVLNTDGQLDRPHPINPCAVLYIQSARVAREGHHHHLRLILVTPAIQNLVVAYPFMQNVP